MCLILRILLSGEPMSLCCVASMKCDVTQINLIILLIPLFAIRVHATKANIFQQMHLRCAPSKYFFFVNSFFVRVFTFPSHQLYRIWNENVHMFKCAKCCVCSFFFLHSMLSFSVLRKVLWFHFRFVNFALVLFWNCIIPVICYLSWIYHLPWIFTLETVFSFWSFHSLHKFTSTTYCDLSHLLVCDCIMYIPYTFSFSINNIKTSRTLAISFRISLTTRSTRYIDWMWVDNLILNNMNYNRLSAIQVNQSSSINIQIRPYP